MQAGGFESEPRFGAKVFSRLLPIQNRQNEPTSSLLALDTILRP